MTIIIEDGSIVPGANSYASETELTAYATQRGITLSGGAEALLIQSMDYAETQSFQGSRVIATQSLQWPRNGVYIDGFLVANNEIPAQLKTAQIVTAIAIDQGNSPNAVIERGIKREKIDVIETEYQDNAISNAIDPKIAAAFSSLILNTGSMFNRVVTRV